MRTVVMSLLLLLLGQSPAPAEQTNLVIFADFACSNPAAGDPDDCLAVEALRRLEAVRILAVVAAGGNASERLSYQLGRSMFPDLVVLPGSRPRARYFSKTHRYIRDIIFGSANAVTVLVLSPATDFAVLVAQNPTVLSKVDQVVFVAGRSPGDKFRLRIGGRTLRDMNYEKNRRSFGLLLKALYEHRIEATFVGFRAAMNTQLQKQFMPSNFAHKSQKNWRRKMRFWFGAAPPAFDVVAAMAVTPWRAYLRCRSVAIWAGRDLVLQTTERSIFSVLRMNDCLLVGCFEKTDQSSEQFIDLTWLGTDCSQ